MFATGYKWFTFRTTATITIDEIKRQYRRLAMEHHPDRGGDLRAMQEINAEFDRLRKRYFHVHESATTRGATYETDRAEGMDDVTARFVEIIDALLKMEGVGVEVCGTFVWLDGSTYEHRDGIKALGARWARRKRRWFIAPEDWKKRGGREWSMGEIRDKHGSEVIREGARPATRKAITA